MKGCRYCGVGGEAGDCRVGVEVFDVDAVGDSGEVIVGGGVDDSLDEFCMAALAQMTALALVRAEVSLRQAAGFFRKRETS